MTLPKRASVESGMEFFQSKAQWVLTNVEADKPVLFVDGAALPILGKECVIRHVRGRGVTQLATDNLQLLAHGDPVFTARHVKDFLKKHLRDECLKHAHAMAKTLGKTVREVRIRDTRSRWGSCTASGVLTFNWRLVFAPTAVLYYLIAHEVAHLAEMNHSARFWDIVMRLGPDMEQSRKWLKKEGHKLHRYG